MVLKKLFSLSLSEAKDFFYDAFEAKLCNQHARSRGDRESLVRRTRERTKREVSGAQQEVLEVFSFLCFFLERF